MTIKELWAKATTENGTLTLEQFEALAKENNVKFADVTDGKYVSVNKYNDDLKSRDSQIEQLNATIKTRDTDLEKVQKQLEAAGTDASKISAISNDLTELQAKYDTDTKALQEQLAKQGYEFAVREFASTKNFTSNAARRDFINSMVDRGLQMSKDGKSIIGAEDFVTEYSADNADAFVVETPPEEGPGAGSGEQLPHLVGSTPGGATQPSDDITGGFANAFNFATVRPMPESK